MRKTCLLAALAFAAVPDIALAQAPNFLLLFGDDMTYTDVGAYGNRDVRTPNLDKLAGEGMRFRYFFNSAPMCAPTRMALYTGIHPVRNGAHPNHSKVYDHIRSLPHYLKPLGYDVALIGKRHFAPLANFPFEYLGGRHHDNGKDGPDIDIDRALSYIENHKEGPWALVVANNQPHTPWNRGDPSAYDARELSLPPYFVDTPETREGLTRYYAEISYMDNTFGRILDGLERLDLTENTFVIFVSEQGSNFPHCKWTLYDTGLRSAAVVRWPERVEAGSVSDALVQYVDILPTFIDLAGGEPAKLDFDGKSFARVLRGESSRHNDYVYGVQTSRGIYSGPEGYGIRTVRDLRYRLIRNLNFESQFQNTVTERLEIFQSWKRAAESDAFARAQVQSYTTRPEYELYDLEGDPYEMHNIVDQARMAATLDRLKIQLASWMDQQNDKGAATEAAAKERQIEQPL